MTIPRYAIYYAPEPSSALHDLGSTWLGRDAVTGAARQQPTVRDLSADDLTRLTSDARRYGLHATLKAPFQLADGRCEADLLDHAAEIARKIAPFDAPPLTLTDLGGFRALTLSRHSDAMTTLERTCVLALEPMRAPLTMADRQRRRPDRLSDRQRQILDQVGYPFSLEEFRFHITLSQRLSDAEAALIDPALAAHVAPVVGAAWTVDCISIFRQPASGEPFLELARFALG